MSNENEIIGCLGPKGTFGSIVAKLLMSKMTMNKCVFYPTHFDVLEAVEYGKIKYGVVGAENSTDGSVTEVIDYFIFNAKNILVYNEVVIPINQCLWGKPDIDLNDVEIIFSHPTGLGQCSESIHALLSPKIQKIAVSSTAAAVSEMVKSSIPAVAIAGSMAEIEGAVIIFDKFQDKGDNETRFWVVSSKCCDDIHPPTGNDRTSLAFKLPNIPGALVSVLNCFSERDLNLSKIESRPDKNNSWEYFFLVDVEAHQQDPLIQEALEDMRTKTSELIVLGSYAQWKEKI
jgi:prephenate dehydratase